MAKGARKGRKRSTKMNSRGARKGSRRGTKMNRRRAQAWVGKRVSKKAAWARSGSSMVREG